MGLYAVCTDITYIPICLFLTSRWDGCSEGQFSVGLSEMRVNVAEIVHTFSHDFVSD